MDIRSLPSYVPGFRDALNLRDLGGYVSADGRRVRKGLLFRSGALGEATAAELKSLNELGLRLILDLRSTREVKECPDPLVTGAVRIRMSGVLDARGREVNMSPGAIMGFVRKPKRIDKDPEATLSSAIAELYSVLAFDNPAYHFAFRQLEQGLVPMLFHCSAGKDRTGVLAMLILLALGVDEETALFDYMLTNSYRHEAIAARARRDAIVERLVPGIGSLIHAREGVIDHFGLRIIEEIKQDYGSLERYFEAEFGLDEKRRAALRDRYLE